MKILHYIRDFSLPSETFLYDLINHLEAHGIDNYIITNNRQLKEERPFKKVKAIDKNRPIFKKIYRKLLGLKSLQTKNTAVQHIKEVAPDVVHAHFGDCGVWMFDILKKYHPKMPLIVSFHGYDVNALPHKNSRYLNKLQLLNKSENVVFISPSEFLKERMLFIGLHQKKIFVIPSAYNQRFAEVEKTNYWQYGEELKLLNIGRCIKLKGQKYLIEAFAKITKIYQNTTLTIIGTGPLEKELKDLAYQLKVADKIKFLNQIKHTEMAKIMLEHDLYVHPAVIIPIGGGIESLSVATIEAQVCGLPAVVSKIGGLKSVVIDGITGKFSLERNTDSIVAQIKYYIDNEDKLKIHGQNAKIKAMAKFNSEKITKQIIKLYKSFNDKEIKC